VGKKEAGRVTIDDDYQRDGTEDQAPGPAITSPAKPINTCANASRFCGPSVGAAGALGLALVVAGVALDECDVEAAEEEGEGEGVVDECVVVVEVVVCVVVVGVGVVDVVVFLVVVDVVVCVVVVGAGSEEPQAPNV
jgi:hypothetical protein